MNHIENTHDFLAYLSKAYGTKPAFAICTADKEYCEVSYEMFYTQVCHTANELQPLLLTEKRIAIVAENSYEWMVYYWSVMFLGKTAVLVDPEVSWNETAARLTALGVCTAFVSTDEHANDKIKKIMMTLSAPNRSIKEQISGVIESPKADAEATILFTTGTTGEYKGVRLSQKNIVSAVITGVADSVEAETVFLPLPFYHSLTINGLITSMSQGCRICIGRGVKYIFKDMHYFAPDLIYVTPIFLNTFYQKIVHNDLNESTLEPYFGKHLRYAVTGGASPQQKVLERLIQCGIRIFTSYGSSETFCIASGEIGSREHYVGKIASHMRVKLLDGEIVAEGPTVFIGYTGSEDLDNGGKWYHTGDLGAFDDDGGLILTGRKKNLIILSNGKNVSPEYLESALCRISQIREAVVYAKDEKICAEVYLGKKADAEMENLVREQIHQLNCSMPTYYHIQKIIFRETEFSHSGIGKIKRNFS